ncbi:hypothetical protein, partial [Mesorhizobium sp. M4B.F.Ca.ET.089.01.1.1]|uniref:hypothetical protein n=1 Tax=Mesorhizobium sp. M4B.F.Ca.ET.089.01.1.1 TaxID=2496662 RepID=UPI001AECF324
GCRNFRVLTLSLCGYRDIHLERCLDDHHSILARFDGLYLVVADVGLKRIGLQSLDCPFARFWKIAHRRPPQPA